MSKKVLIILAIGIIVIVAAFFIHKFEVEKVLDEAALEPVVKPKKTKTQPVMPESKTDLNAEPGHVQEDEQIK